MTKRVPTDEELAQAAADLEANDSLLAQADLHLDGGNAQTDDAEGQAAEHEKRTGQRAEMELLRANQDRLQAQLEQTQEFVRQLIEAGQGVPQIGGQAQAQQRRAVHDAMIRAMIQRGGRAVILIHPDPTPNMNWPVPLGINGTVIYVKRGVPTEVPVEFVGVLEDARKEEVAPLLDQHDNPIPGGMIIDQLSYAYTLMPGAHPEESLLPGFRPIDRDLERGANQPRVEPKTPTAARGH